MYIKPLVALTLVLSVAGCQPTTSSLRTDGTIEVPDSATEVSLTELDGRWAGHWTATGDRATLTVLGDDPSALGLEYCLSMRPCRNIDGAKFEGGAIRWSRGQSYFAFWLEGEVLRGVQKEFSKDRWWTSYTWMERVGAVPVIRS